MAIPIPEEFQKKCADENNGWKKYDNLDKRKRFCPRLSFVLDSPDNDDVVSGKYVEVELDDNAIKVLELIYPDEFSDAFEEYKDRMVNTHEINELIKERNRNRNSPSPTEGYIYFIKVEGRDIFKIGITAKNVKSRIANIQTSCPYPIELYATYESDDYENEEAELHERFKDRQTSGEWFNLTPLEVDALQPGL